LKTKGFSPSLHKIRKTFRAYAFLPIIAVQRKALKNKGLVTTSPLLFLWFLSSYASEFRKLQGVRLDQPTASNGS